MTRRTLEERLQEAKQKEEEAKKKAAQMEVRRKQLEVQAKNRERKDRTHRLILVGSIFEHHWGFMSPERAEWLAQRLAETVEKMAIENET